MAIAIRIERETGLAIVTCSGALGPKDAEKAAKALWEFPGWSGTAVVWDFREAHFDVSPSDVREVAQFIVHRQPTPPPRRVAWVTPRDVDFGLARMFEVFREDEHTDFCVFRDCEEAIAWALFP